MKRLLRRLAARPHRFAAALVLGCGVVLVVPAMRASADAGARSVEVAIDKFAFGPKDVTVAPGTRVVWTNHDEAPHTVASTDKSFASKGMDTDDKFEHVFASEGDFGYICTVHPFMTGVVHVRKP
jgi:plastocyanin